MPFSDEEILEDLVESTRSNETPAELYWSESFIFRSVEKLRKRKRLTQQQREEYRLQWYLQKRDTPKYKRNRVKAQLAYQARNGNRREYKKEWYRANAAKKQVAHYEAQLLKYLKLYLTFNPAEEKRAHVVALLQLFEC